VRLLDTPEDVSVLAPLVLREIDYRLLQSEQFGRLAQMAIGDGRLRRVSGAITWIKDHFTEPLQIEALAKRVHMSPSALHHHFKAATAMSPISTRSSCGCRRLAVFCYRLRRARRRSPTRWGTRVHRSSAANTPGSLASHRVETRNACAMPWLV
jgi:AraC-like DNA-binding protein